MRKVTENDREFIRERSAAGLSLREIAAVLARSAGVTVSHQTVANIIRDAGAVDREGREAARRRVFAALDADIAAAKVAGDDRKRIALERLRAEIGAKVRRQAERREAIERDLERRARATRLREDARRAVGRLVALAGDSREARRAGAVVLDALEAAS
jgi:hypothetical protein